MVSGNGDHVLARKKNAVHISNAPAVRMCVTIGILLSNVSQIAVGEFCVGKFHGLTAGVNYQRTLDPILYVSKLMWHKNRVN